MRSGAAGGHDGYFHEAAVYSSDEELLAIVVPFLREGVAAGEPTLVTFAERTTALIRAAIGRDAHHVRFLPGDVPYTRPATAIRMYREMLAEQAARGVGQIRVVGGVPHPEPGASRHGWARYEAAANHAYADFPVWGLCAYDTPPPAVLADIARTHPYIVTADGGHRVNEAFEDPVAVLAGLLTSGPLPDEGQPAIDAVAPVPSAARHAVRTLAQECGLGEDECDDAVMAASETVVNGLLHGLPPVRLRVWPGRKRLVIAVTDAGTGPTDPFAGLLPATDTTGGGLGLWVTHQICRDVTFHRDPAGFTVRMVVEARG
jgi:anti-sigma regulatory factor (Ser/Thr protein kinase)